MAMTNNQATALLALVEANKALDVARTAFARMGDGESAALLTEEIDDHDTIITALAAKSKGARS